ncbi:hypothetical protein AAGW05_14935 [Arthrobacter sp. LAPM80]|uniref:hypothetical protein n=1 Tax=Arthrobacter sp. LAPM80 TaxID=3141788 RepID=UPI00398AC14B
MMTLAFLQALLGFTSEVRWLRYAKEYYQGMFPYLPGQSGYNRRLRRLGQCMNWLVAALGE